MIKKIFLITSDNKKDTKTFEDLVQHIKIHYKVSIDIKKYNEVITDYDDNIIVLLYLSDEEIKIYLKNHLDSGQKVGILPTKDNQNSIQSYGLSKDLHEALDICFDKENFLKIDILLCNSQIAFLNVIIGDVHGLNNTKVHKQDVLSKIKGFYKNLLNLNFKDFTLVTSKDQIIQTSATGIMVLEHNLKKYKNSFLDEEFSFQDGKFNAFILAPSSKLEYLYYLFKVFFLGKLSSKNLPKSLGLIKTYKLNINSSKPIDYKIDGVLISTKEIELEVKKDCLDIALNKELFQFDKNQIEEEDKDTIKIQNLPKGDMKTLLINEPVPLFRKAGEEEFKELFLGLKDSSKLSSIFLVLMVLSTLLSTTGLYQNSVPVIIGAMVLAPLMAPIISLAMGVVRGSETLIKNSSKTLFFGILIALLFSCLLTFFMPLSSLTEEMAKRLNPNILDLIVAIISGIAGAYANSKSEVAKSMAGVAIAVALVPPLSVTGIAIGWGDIDMMYGSFLLFITNLVGITLFAAITFIVLGYAPINRAKKGIFYTSVILLVIIVPLVASFYKLIEQNKILMLLNKKEYIINDKKLILNILDIDLSKDDPNLSIQINSQDILQKKDFIILKEKIEEKIEKKIILNISSKVVIK